MKWKFKRKLGIEGGAVFTFGVPDSNYFESWDNNYRLLDVWTCFDDKEKN
jgi:hypothetical protein